MEDNPYSIQYCCETDDITGSPYCREDATEVRVWHESGDLVACVTVDGDGYWYGTDDQGTDFGNESKSAALDFIDACYMRLSSEEEQSWRA